MNNNSPEQRVYKIVPKIGVLRFINSWVWVTAGPHRRGGVGGAAAGPGREI